jgi:hypothetical protein
VPWFPPHSRRRPRQGPPSTRTPAQPRRGLLIANAKSNPSIAVEAQIISIDIEPDFARVAVICAALLTVIWRIRVAKMKNGLCRAHPCVELRGLSLMPGRARPVALTGRGSGGVAARAISVRVGDVSNIAAAGSGLVLGKKVRHVGHRRCRQGREAARCGNETDRESFHETGRVSSVVHDSFFLCWASADSTERCRVGRNVATPSPED